MLNSRSDRPVYLHPACANNSSLSRESATPLSDNLLCDRVFALVPLSRESGLLEEGSAFCRSSARQECKWEAGSQRKWLFPEIGIVRMPITIRASFDMHSGVLPSVLGYSFHTKQVQIRPFEACDAYVSADQFP